MVPLICIGERTTAVSRRKLWAWQSKNADTHLRSSINVPDETEVLLAYEPVWAIRATVLANPDHVLHFTEEIRQIIAGRKGVTRLLYGGSTAPGTFAKIAEGVDGLFLGPLRA
jgi:triosephosphate isomerase